MLTNRIDVERTAGKLVLKLGSHCPCETASRGFKHCGVSKFFAFGFSFVLQ